MKTEIRSTIHLLWLFLQGTRTDSSSFDRFLVISFLRVRSFLSYASCPFPLSFHLFNNSTLASLCPDRLFSDFLVATTVSSIVCETAEKKHDTCNHEAHSDSNDDVIYPAAETKLEEANRGRDTHRDEKAGCQIGAF